MIHLSRKAASDALEAKKPGPEGKKILVCGGHLSPVLSFIEALPKTDKVIFIGRKYAFEGENKESLEYKTIKEKGILFLNITTGRFQRSFSRHTMFSATKIPAGLFQAIGILRREKPDVVVGFGGYISFPLCLAAFILRVPIVIHEQTQEAGFSNKLLSVVASKVCISWETSREFFPKDKTVLTGNPVRKEFLKYQISNIKYQISNELPLIYVTGGETGSHFINNLILESLDSLLKNYGVYHQVGESRHHNDYEALGDKKKEISDKLRQRYQIVRFVHPDDVPRVLDKADLVISRSGINTVTELAYLGKPSIFIPLPFAQRDEQKKNASLLKNVGLSEILEQKDATSEKLIDLVARMFDNIDRYRSNASAARRLVNEDAADLLVKTVYETAQRKKR